ncbi:phenylacetate--CoA ligase family protein [Anaeromyxobacter oryzae]|uniref:Phenylacetate--CoA ligase n=1 Tax=Anaeromyxobacter oryzae TaxID=2918170 RepID=A0ABM7WUI8_9BACT|nr:phenylacetate--CoA ligase family protein [Anaeromyxobacter oryzae]BDG03132.1 phenylacetate--CoA ligase [Anaeromyxobacter oryzae]
MLPDRTSRALSALDAFVRAPLSRVLDPGALANSPAAALALFRDVAATVPAYREFLAAHGVDPASVRTHDDFATLPLLTKEGYVRRYPVARRCRGGDLSRCDFIAVSSGSTGEPTFWPRFLDDELAVASRFEHVLHDSFEADRRRTLAVVCFPLGAWVGGMFTASCLRHLAVKGYPITTVTPGNQKPEVLRLVRALAPSFEQTVLLGYPPFLKDVVDAGIADGVPWREYHVKLVLAGEVFSEEWRTLMAERAGLTRPLHDSASLYGTADAGVLGNETPLSVCIRRFLASRPEGARSIFGEARLPTLVQYDPSSRWFEEHDGTLVFSADGGVPLVRYHLDDTGGVVPYATMIARVRDLGLDAEAEVRRAGDRGVRPLPFAYVFGRAHFAVSFYGANVFPETVSVALEQPQTRDFVTGKFVMEVKEDAARDRHLHVAVELAPGAEASDARVSAVADAIAAVLRRLDSEFARYVPPERQRPEVRLCPAGDPEWFPAGVKHRYARK